MRVLPRWMIFAVVATVISHSSFLSDRHPSDSSRHAWHVQFRLEVLPHDSSASFLPYNVVGKSVSARVSIGYRPHEG